MSNVLIDRLIDFFGPPERAGNVEAFIAELMRALSGFGHEALDRAASSLIAGGGTSWPAPKDIVAACADEQERSDEARALRPKVQLPGHEHDRAAQAWAVNYCRVTEIGKRSFAEGWGREVWNWAKSYARESYRYGASPEMSRRPTVEEVEYWVHYCRVPSTWCERERVTLLGEPWSRETNDRLNRKIADIRAGKWKLPAMRRMPTEDDAA